MGAIADLSEPDSDRSSGNVMPLPDDGLSVPARARALASQLVKQRQFLGLTSKQVSELTKLHPRFVDAIEKGEFGLLPGGFLSKSFVRAYAQCVQMNDMQVVEQYLELSRPELTTSGVDTPSQPAFADRTEHSRGFAFVVFFVAIACVGCFLSGRYWQQHYTHHEGDQPVLSATRTQQQPELPEMNKPSVEATASQQSAAHPMMLSQYAAPRDQTPLDMTGECDGTGFCIEIAARQDAWISINADGKVVMRDTLLAHTRRRIAARHHVVIRAGNIGALDFSFNGLHLPTQGDYDEARTLNFSPDGLQQRPSTLPAVINNY